MSFEFFALKIERKWYFQGLEREIWRRFFLCFKNSPLSILRSIFNYSVRILDYFWGGNRHENSFHGGVFHHQHEPFFTRLRFFFSELVSKSETALSVLVWVQLKALDMDLMSLARMSFSNDTASFLQHLGTKHPTWYYLAKTQITVRSDVWCPTFHINYRKEKLWSNFLLNRETNL